MESLILRYGYGLLFLGTFLEGESVLIIAGFLAHQGYLRLDWVIFSAFLGTLAGDQLFFQLGKHRGARFLARREWFNSRRQRVAELLDRYQVWLVFGYRFVYGIRNVTPFVVGASGFPALRFLLLNICASVLWTAVFATLGYSFGSVVATFLADVERYESRIVLAILALAPVLWWISRRKFGRTGKAQGGKRRASGSP